MRFTRFLQIATIVTVATLILAPLATAQTPSEQREAFLKQISDQLQQLPPDHQRALSGGASNLLPRDGKVLRPTRGAAPTSAGAAAIPSLASPRQLPFGQVNDSNTDVALSHNSGFTQSETSTAWCGTNVLIGFNDSGSFWETFPTLEGLSFNGWSRSTNYGNNFFDMGHLPTSDFDDFLAGDPVLDCKNAWNFYYASLYLEGDTNESCISVSPSTDGGATFADPIKAVCEPASTHFLDKPWFAVDENNTNNLYVSYTDFYAPNCAAIEFVRSTNGGATWSAPIVLDGICDPIAFVQGSQIGIGDTNGEVYVAWERFPSGFGFNRQIRLRRSTSSGAGFGGLLTAASGVLGIGDGFALRGGFRAFIDLQSIAVNKTNGHVYIVYHDSGNLIPDPNGRLGFYDVGDIFFRRSTDQGTTWSGPIRVNQIPEPNPFFNNALYDQFHPSLAVDRTGRILVTYYDRTNDPKNFLFKRNVSQSNNGGATWGQAAVGTATSAPIHAFDQLTNLFYMGDYDQVTNQQTGSQNGWVGAYQVILPTTGNPDVRSYKFP